jgi:Lar family restriction alleviation protein
MGKNQKASLTFSCAKISSPNSKQSFGPSSYKVLPCPFCGSDLQNWLSWKSSDEIDEFLCVTCDGCNASSGFINLNLKGDPYKKAIKNWNKRERFELIQK